MFGLNNRREVERVLCRLLSRTAFDRLEERGETRSCQVMPVLLTADANGEPATGEPACGLITDLCSRGAGIYVQRLVQAEHLFLGMRLETRTFTCFAAASQAIGSPEVAFIESDWHCSKSCRPLGRVRCNVFVP